MERADFISVSQQTLFLQSVIIDLAGGGLCCRTLASFLEDVLRVGRTYARRA
jgi:hypothetical protein